MAKTLSEAQISILKDGLNVLFHKYGIEAENFLNLINDEYSEIENYNFENEKVDIWMNEEISTIYYSIDEMLRYLSNIDKIKFDENSAWCNNIKQYIIEVDQWKAEKVNLKKYTLNSDFFNIKIILST